MTTTDGTVQQFLLPDVGEGLTEAEIVTWLVKVGDVVKINDVLVEIETAKSLVELPSPYAGTVTALLADEGATVPVGSPIIAISQPGSPPGDTGGKGSADPGSGSPAEEAEAPLTLVGYGPRSGSAQRRARRGPATPTTLAGSAAQLQVQGTFEQPGVQTTTEVVAADEPVVPSVAVRPEAATGTALAKPMVRLRARELGVDLSGVQGTGPAGSVTLEDLESGADRREPVKGVRKAMAQAMVSSAFSIPHVTEWVEVDVTRTTKLLGRVDDRPAQPPLSPLVAVAKAVCLAIRRTPEVNAVWDEASQEVAFRRVVNLGIAAATPRGLVVPNIKGADSLGLLELAEALRSLTATAREGRSSPADLSGGTFTITNVGVFGVDGGTPIINPGESAILCVGAVRPKPWVHRGRVRVRDVTTLALSFDHRFIDGAAGSRFLADVAGILHDPASALAR